QRAILAGDAETGITIMQMDEGLDTGAILLQQSVPIAAADTAQTLHDKLAGIGAHAIIAALRTTLAPRAQDDAGTTYAAKISKVEAQIDWKTDAALICRQVRAFNPAPGATSNLDGKPYKIWMAHAVPHRSMPAGTTICADSDSILVAAGKDAVAITELQK